MEVKGKINLFDLIRAEQKLRKILQVNLARCAGRTPRRPPMAPARRRCRCRSRARRGRVPGWSSAAKSGSAISRSAISGSAISPSVRSSSPSVISVFDELVALTGCRRRGSLTLPFPDGVDDEQDHAQRTGADAHPGDQLGCWSPPGHQGGEPDDRTSATISTGCLLPRTRWCRHRISCNRHPPESAERPSRAGPTSSWTQVSLQTGGTGARRCATARGGPPARCALLVDRSHHPRGVAFPASDCRTRPGPGRPRWPRAVSSVGEHRIGALAASVTVDRPGCGRR